MQCNKQFKKIDNKKKVEVIHLSGIFTSPFLYFLRNTSYFYYEDSQVKYFLDYDSKFIIFTFKKKKYIIKL